MSSKIGIDIQEIFKSLDQIQVLADLRTAYSKSESGKIALSSDTCQIKFGKSLKEILFFIPKFINDNFGVIKGKNCILLCQ